MKFSMIIFVDISTFTMVYKSARAALDRSNTIHCTHLCNILMD